MLALRSALVSLGHDCELFFFERGTMEPYLPPGVPVHFGSLADCLRLVSRNGFDVVHANNVDWPTGISAVRRVGAKLVLTAHKVRPPAWTYGWTSANCDALTTVSHDIRGELQPYTDVPIQVVHNGVDIHRFAPRTAPQSPPPIIAWIGRGTSPLKGLDRFATVAPLLRDAGFRVWLIDQHGPAVFAEQHPASAEVLRRSVERWDGVPYERMPALYQEIAASGGCVVSTSRAEGLPLALLEAQSCGCGVIASDVRGNRECVSNQHGGLLYSPGLAPADLAALIANQLSDRSHLRACQAAAATWVRSQFSLEGMAGRYLEIYRDAPFDGVGSLAARVRARMRLSPLLDWRAYLEQRWGVGYRQYQTSSELMAAGDAPLAAAAAKASFKTTPTLAFRPRRLATLLRYLTS